MLEHENSLPWIVVVSITTFADDALSVSVLPSPVPVLHSKISEVALIEKAVVSETSSNRTCRCFDFDEQLCWFKGLARLLIEAFLREFNFASWNS